MQAGQQVLQADERHTMYTNNRASTSSPIKRSLPILLWYLWVPSSVSVVERSSLRDDQNVQHEAS